MVQHIKAASAAAVLVLCFMTSGCISITPAPQPVQPQTYHFNDAMRGEIVKTALGQLGTRYRSGGTSPFTGFDCSGFIWWIYSQKGISIPRESSSQALAGQSVSSRNMLPGDIIIFRGVSRSWTGRHVALYMGDGQFVHCPNARSTVRIDELSDPYWGKLRFEVRRIII